MDDIAKWTAGQSREMEKQWKETKLRFLPKANMDKDSARPPEFVTVQST